MLGYRGCVLNVLQRASRLVAQVAREGKAFVPCPSALSILPFMIALDNGNGDFCFQSRVSRARVDNCFC